MDNPFIRLTTLKVMWTGQSEKVTCSPLIQTLKDKARGLVTEGEAGLGQQWWDVKAKAQFNANTPTFFLSGYYCLKYSQKKIHPNVIIQSNLCIYLHILLCFFSLPREYQKSHFVFPHSMGIHSAVGANPVLISAVTFQIEMLIWAYYHRECFPGENYPEH